MAVTMDSANPHEVELAEQILDARFVDGQPEHRICNNAYGSDGWDATLAAHGIERIGLLIRW